MESIPSASQLMLLLLIPFAITVLHLVAAGVLYTRTRSKGTTLYLIGLVLSALVSMVLLLQAFLPDLMHTFSALQGLVGVIAFVATLISAVGLLIYALSLPRRY